MKNAPLTIAVGLAVLAIGGLVGAQFVKSHTISVRLPNGGVARVFYTGDVPPGITVAPDARTRRLLLRIHIVGRRYLQSRRRDNRRWPRRAAARADPDNGKLRRVVAAGPEDPGARAQPNPAGGRSGELSGSRAVVAPL